MAGYPVTVEMSEPIQGGGIDPSAMDALIDCMRDDRVGRWAAEVRAAIADSQGMASGIVCVPERDEKADRAREIELEIRRLQKELTTLGRA